MSRATVPNLKGRAPAARSPNRIPTRDETVVLYDGECPFCRASVALLLLWDPGRRLRPVTVQSAEAKALLPEMGEQERLASWHLVVPGERAWSAGAAAPPLLRLLPAGAPLAALAERFPHATQRGYEVVSHHRDLIGRLIPGPLRRWVDAVIARRE